MINPKVSVIMPVFNAELFLRESIDSILNQTYTNFEFLIINDGSTDASQEIIDSYKDARIICIHHTTNLGLIHSLNKGLKKAKGVYICRMDADDISLPKRLEKQITFLERNHQIEILGTAFKWMPTYKTELHPFSSSKCNVKLLFATCLAHPSVVIRKSLIDRLHLQYDESYKFAEDYFLWVEVAIKRGTISNLRESLLLYRIHEHQTSTAFFNKQQEVVKRIQWWYAQRCFDQLTESDRLPYLQFINNDFNEFQQYFKIKHLLRKILQKEHISSHLNFRVLKAEFKKQLRKTAKKLYLSPNHTFKGNEFYLALRDPYYFRYLFRKKRST